MKNTLYMIGNTHFDPVWLWTWDEAMASIRATFRSALERMEEDGEFVYSFCTPPVFDWIKRVDPAMFREIRERVAQGRWDVEAEGWWLQPDCNALMGESLVRQGLYGQRYLLENFGKTATTVFNIDSFGHSVMIPQILKKCGLSYYVFTRPGPAERELPDPLFAWESPDGSRVLAYRCGQLGGDSYAQELRRGILDSREALASAEHDFLMVYGVSDHGGAPTKKAIADIHRLQDEMEDVCVRFGSTTAFFEAQEGRVSETVRGEIQTRFYGVFSDYPAVKKNNRRAEYAALNAEKAAVLAGWLCGGEYPREELAGIWKDVLFNQFHDILGGACILDAYTDARDRHGRALHNAGEILHTNLQRICRRIAMPGSNDKGTVWNLVVFNLNAAPFADYLEAEVQWAWEFPWYRDGIELLDEEQTVCEAQIVQERSVLPGFRSRFVFHAQIPPLGYKVYTVRKTNKPVKKNTAYRPAGSPFTPVVFRDEGDVWCFNTMDGYGDALEPMEILGEDVVEQGPLMTTVRIIRRFRQSTMEETVTRYRGAAYVDYRFRVNWNEPHTVLKLAVNQRPENAHVMAAAPYGCVQRETDGIEWPVGEWLSVRGDADGFTLLSDSVFAYDTDKKDGTLRLTRLRSPVVGDLRWGEPLAEHGHYAYLGQGIHEGRIRYFPAALLPEELPGLAACFNNPPVVVLEANHGGDLPCTDGLVELSAKNVGLSVLKQAEDGDDVVLRMAEYGGRSCKTQVRVGPLGTYSLDFQPFEIKTVRLSAAGLMQTDMLERPAPAAE